MRAWRYAAFGSIDSVLHIESVPAPQLGAHDVLVRTRFVGINPLDWKLVEGQFRWLARSRPPCGVAAEFAGEIVDVGSKVETLTPGQRVVCWLNPFVERPRALAEQIAVPAAQCVRVPHEVTLEQAAVTPVAGLSALQLCDMDAPANAGQRCPVHR